RLGRLGALTLKNDWLAGVATDPDRGREFDGSEEAHAELSRGPLRTAAREDVDFMLAMRTDKVTHVFDHTDDVHFELAEHLDSFAGVLQRDIRGRGDNDGATYRNCLDERNCDIAGPWRQVNDQEIQLAPHYLLQKLPGNRVQH